MTEDMNRFGYNAEGKICDYGEEEPKVLTDQEILEELNRLDQANYDLSSECTSVNWSNEFLREQVDTLERALEKIYISLWLVCNYTVNYQTQNTNFMKNHLMNISIISKKKH